MIYLEELIQQKFQRPLDDIMAELKPKALMVPSICVKRDFFH